MALRDNKQAGPKGSEALDLLRTAHAVQDQQHWTREVGEAHTEPGAELCDARASRYDEAKGRPRRFAAPELRDELRQHSTDEHRLDVVRGGVGARRAPLLFEGAPREGLDVQPDDPAGERPTDRG